MGGGWVDRVGRGRTDPAWEGEDPSRPARPPVRGLTCPVPACQPRTWPCHMRSLQCLLSWGVLPPGLWTPAASPCRWGGVLCAWSTDRPGAWSCRQASSRR